MNVTGFLKQALPWIGAAATGNVPALANLAIQTVSNVVGKKLSDADEVADAVAGATPDQLIALKQAELEFQEKCKQLNLQTLEDLEKISADDRANARAREVSLKDKIPAVLAIGITLGFFGLLGTLLRMPPPAADKDLLEIMLGALGSGWASVVAYYFGSSAAHDKLTQTLGDKN